MTTSVVAANAPLTTRTRANVATVFGCTGFPGRYTVNRFGRIGAQVVVPYRGEEKAINHLKVMGDVGQIIPLKYSFSSQQSVDTAIEHSNIVVNCINANASTRNWSVRDANVETTRILAMTAKKFGVQRFIHVSCVGADKESPSEFARAKAEAEEVVKDIFPTATILRTTHLFGHEDSFLNKWGYFFRFTSNLFLPIPLESKVQPLYVGDFADALIAVLSKDETQGRTYELGGPEVFTLSELIEKVVGPTLVINPKIWALPEPFSKWFASLLEKTRRSAWRADDIELFSTNLIVKSNAEYTMKNLELRPPVKIEDVAPGVLRVYRFIFSKLVDNSRKPALFSSPA